MEAGEARTLELSALSSSAAARSAAMAALFGKRGAEVPPSGGPSPVDATNALASPLVSSSEWLRRKALGGAAEELPKTTLNYRPPEMDVLDPAWGEGVDMW